MSVEYTRINWEDSPSTQTPLNAENLNAMDSAIDDLAGAVNDLDGVPSDIEELQTDVAGLKNDLNQLESAYSAFVVETATGAIASFTDGADDVPVKDLTVAIEPVQSGSGDPSPDNVRPISGWTGANVTVCGVNLLDMSHPEGIYGTGTYVVNDDGTITVTTAGSTASVQFILTGKLPAGTYTVKNFSSDKQAYVQIGSLSDYSHVLNRDGGTFTFQYDGKSYLRIVHSNQEVQTTMTYKLQLELGSTASAYVPYQGDTVSVDWTTEAGTVYGGTLDVTTGVLTVDRAMLSTEDMIANYNSYNANTGKYIVYMYGNNVSISEASESASNPSFAYCNCLPCNVSWNEMQSMNRSGKLGVYRNPDWDYTRIYISIADETVNTKALAETWMTNNNFQLTYKLATPKTYQLTPQEVSTVLGQNNIFADCGDSTVQYRADTKLYIDKVLSA